ncbi:MAG TPA: DUF2865 domain-containing protein [Xanthobacteraceae bacterium]|nr:DUF2865 domain-containing protein [Xanthobacteraceae bacterium]
MGARPTGMLAAAALALAGAGATAFAQGVPLPQGAAPAPNQTCVRLESQLALIDRGATDPARADQIKRAEDAVKQQQFELDRLQAQARRNGCEGSGFFLFGGQPPQCADLNSQIQRVRGGLDRLNSDLQRLQGGTLDRGEQRRAVLMALAQNDCGPQYRAAAPARPQNFFEALFGGTIGPSPAPSPLPGETDMTQTGTYRTLCVRTCDGYYFPISFSTVPSRFPDDERVCQRTCPATEVVLFTHRNPGEDVNQAVSLSGRPYRDLPNAFHYRQAFDSACSCRRSGQSWADALGRDATVERGDIIITDDRAKALAQPKAEPPAKQPKQDAKRAKGAPEPPPPAADPAAAAAPAAPSSDPDAKQPVRQVGPQFLPAR